MTEKDAVDDEDQRALRPRLQASFEVAAASDSTADNHSSRTSVERIVDSSDESS